MPSECYVSVRIGEHQKFSRLSEKRAFKFAQAPKDGRYSSRYGKIEIFRRIGTCGLDVDPAREGLREVLVNCSEAGFGSVSMQVALDKLGKAAPGGADDAAPAADERPQVQSTRGQQAKDYLREHCLEVCLSDAVQAVLRERPADPIVMLVQKLQAASKSRIVQQQDELQRPATQSTSASSGTAKQGEAVFAAPQQKQVPTQLERGPTPVEGTISTLDDGELHPVDAVPADQLSRETKDLARSLVDSARRGKLLPLLQELSQHAASAAVQDQNTSGAASSMGPPDRAGRCSPEGTRLDLTAGQAVSSTQAPMAPTLDTQKQLSSTCTAGLQARQDDSVDLVTALPSMGSWYSRRLEPLSRSNSREGTPEWQNPAGGGS